MRTLIENLCGKLEKWGIDPILLAKSIGIFIVLITALILMVTYPIILIIFVIILLSIVLIGLIYTAIK